MVNLTRAKGKIKAAIRTDGRAMAQGDGLSPPCTGRRIGRRAPPPQLADYSSAIEPCTGRRIGRRASLPVNSRLHA